MRCDSGQLWEGNVGEPSSLENRISECKIKCDGYTQCKFIHVNILNDWCRIHSSCDTTTSTNSDSITLAKKGISLLVSIISQIIDWSIILRILKHIFQKLINTKVNCQWSSWTVGSCSQTCGGGALTKTRSKTIEEANGGTCQGQPSETEICNPQNCPGTLFLVHRYKTVDVQFLLKLVTFFS